MDISTVGDIYQVFQNKKWHYILGEDSKEIFERFCRLVMFLNEDERKLVLYLSNNYLVMKMNSYENMLREAFRSIDDEIIKGCDNIFVISIISPEDSMRRHEKSGTFLLYPALKGVIPSDGRFAGKKIHSSDTVAGVALSKDHNSKTLMIFIDDFLGSGDTFLSFYSEFKRRVKMRAGDVCIAVLLVAQELGILAVENVGIRVFCPIRRGKGISDDPEIKDATKALSLMKGLERRLGVPLEYEFGYGASEALITMIRTPDNTFPVFWWEGQIDGKHWRPPFARSGS